MEGKQQFDVVIIGGSFAGLSAAMTLGRSLRKVLIIDSGKPCNRQTPHSHNFITHDGAIPKEITEKAKSQVLEYPTVKFHSEWVVSVIEIANGFEISTKSSQTFRSKKVLFATGVKDIMPNLKGFAECWGISVLHCPYCHGYEVVGKKIGVIANGETAFDLCTLIQHWADKLTLFTNGKSELTKEQIDLIKKLNITIVEKQIEELNHNQGNLESVVFEDGMMTQIDAVFSRVPYEQHCGIPIQLGCQTTETGHIEVDFFQKTNIDGIYAAGDNTTPLRTVAQSTSQGNKAGIFLNKELLNEELPK